jgi:membrane-associated PAP2 superfamily phosphatase
LLLSLFFIKKSNTIKQYKKAILIVVLSAIIVPVAVGGLKKYTNMPCPKNELYYGGKMIKTTVWQQYTLPYKAMPSIACWPAGHASGGFVLLSLFFFFKTRRNRYIALIVALIIGWCMGIYKMLIGDHFLSHTIITMLIAWLIILIITKLIGWLK